MKKEELEQLANLVEQLLLLGKKIIPTRENYIAYYPVPESNDGYNLGWIAASVANKALAKGFCSDKILQRAIRGRAYTPSETIEITKPRFTLRCLYYHEQKVSHIILFGK